MVNDGGLFFLADAFTLPERVVKIAVGCKAGISLKRIYTYLHLILDSEPCLIIDTFPLPLGVFHYLSLD